MAVSYVTQKCMSCAGTKLEYVKELKAWRCAYCGTLIERHEQVDTMFTIKNVVRQALLDVAYLRMDSAQKNLVECEKIDSRYVGTVIADLAYRMNMMVHDSVPPHEQRNMFALLKKSYAQLLSEGENPTEEEMALYDFCDSAEVLGLLILVYDSLGAGARKEYVLRGFDPSGVYSPELNSDLLAYFMKQKQWDLFDGILANGDNLDRRQALFAVLTHYPDTEKKTANVRFLLEAEIPVLSEDDRDGVEDYLDTSADGVARKNELAALFCQTPARPSIECLMRSVISRLSDLSQLKTLLDGMMSVELCDMEIYTILDYALGRCECPVCLYLLERLRGTAQFVEITPQHFGTLLSRSESSANKKAMVEGLLKFSVSDKVKERFISQYLCDIKDTPERRAELVPYLLSLIGSLSTAGVERYLLNSSLDGGEKPAVVKRLFSMEINRSFFRTTLNNYILRSSDPPQVRKEIIAILAEAGLEISPKTVLELICGNLCSPEDRVALLRLFRNNGLDYNEILSPYLQQTDRSLWQGYVLGELIAGASSVSEGAFARYLLEWRDEPALKVERVRKLARLCISRLSDVSCSVVHNGARIYGSVLQAYVLVSPDGEDTAAAVLSVFSGEFSELHREVDVSGLRMKFKKYIATQKYSLSNVTVRLCKEAHI